MQNSLMAKTKKRDILLKCSHVSLAVGSPAPQALSSWLCLSYQITALFAHWCAGKSCSRKLLPWFRLDELVAGSVLVYSRFSTYRCTFIVTSTPLYYAFRVLEEMKQRTNTPAISVSVASTGLEPFAGSIPRASRKNGTAAPNLEAVKNRVKINQLFFFLLLSD